MTRNAPSALTPGQLTHLRAAEDIVFEFHSTAEGKCTGALRAEISGGHAIVPVVCTVVDYEGVGTPLTARACVATSSEVWRTAVEILQPGQALELILFVDASNQYLRAAGLHLDKVSLRVHRSNGAPYTFPLVQVVAPDNAARLVQR
jgi:hypothetical protein